MRLVMKADRRVSKDNCHGELREVGFSKVHRLILCICDAKALANQSIYVFGFLRKKYGASPRRLISA
jgi:hypothetical protein